MVNHIFKYCAYGALKKAGWDYNRLINTTDFVKAYQEYGFPILNHVLEFLSRFGNLKINFLNLRNGIDDNFDFDVRHGLEVEVIERVKEDYMPRINNKKMCIIGTAYRDHYVLLMDEDGKVYGGYDSYFVKIGDSGENAIEAIIEGRQSDVIPEL